MGNSIKKESGPKSEQIKETSMNLSGNTILITGGGTGIGLKLAAEFVAKGNKVIITGRRMEKLKEAQESVPELEILQGDVGSIQGVKALADKVIKDFPKEIL